jgi:hypothetical protein
MVSNPPIKDNLNCFAGISVSRYKQISILLLVGLALFLRIHHLDHESLWMDEIRQTSYYGNSLSEIIDNAASQNQPPLDYWIGHFVYFLSSSDFAVRLPAALFGTASVVLLVMLISQISAWPIACGFGILSAFMPFNLYYSQEARPYAIAVFLFLCIYWTLNRFLSTVRKKKLIPASALLILSVIFLHSRALSPLVMTVCLILILVLWLLFDLKPTGTPAAEKNRMILIACGAFILALLFYLPSLKFILLNSKRMVSDTSLGLNVDRLIAAITKFDLMPIWRAYAVQSEPITYPLVFLVCLSPFFGWYLGLRRKNTIWVLTTLLLPSASILNLIIFQSKSSLPFRPAYVSYLLPLACILGAVSIQGLWTVSAKVRLVHIARSLMVILAALFAFQTLMSAIDYKTIKRKSDWRGVTTFLAENFDTRHLLIFDTFSHYGSWEPTFYGFPRYYRGRSPIASVDRIPFYASKMAALSLTPVFILFQWRKYFLTSRSPYPILSVPSPALETIDYKKICRDPGLICTEFTGFSLIQLRETSKNLAQDTYGIIEKLLFHSPQGSWNVELQLAAAALARAIQLEQWHDHLMQAEAMVSGEQLRKVKDVAEYIRRINPP